MFQPVPERPVPFLVGGNSPAAPRRAAELGDWWQGVMLTPETFAGHRARLDELSGGRPVNAGARIAWDGEGRDADEAGAKVGAWRAVGAGRLAVSSGELGEVARRMRVLAGAVGLSAPAARS
ncbi:hypothetical protein [Streptomyces coffeae]|uniref:LLM class flavin-dependent oxidoreductase n=1 Tax=Streptomyces coffeae TaxID=621382 RepID=A0ABS1NH29_9ACTN|nr:hypothetical protein [Streptomyces coffeae]MBL1099417.1 hypothetical protein [Streptomyces coffeae]